MQPLQAKQWLTSVARQRIRLCRDKRSRKDMNAALHAERILAYLSAFQYSKPALIGSFILRHKAEIAEIIPGEGSKCHDKKKQEFNELLHYYASILQNSI